MSIRPDPSDDILNVIRAEIATWRATAARGSRALIGARHIVVDSLDRAMSFESGHYHLEQASPDLIGVSFLTLENALRQVEALPGMFLTVHDAFDYAIQRAGQAERLLDTLLDKQAGRTRDSEALAAAGGNPAQAERAQEANDDANLRARVLAAVVREMGLAAPPEGSKLRDELAERLFYAVSSHSLARVEMLSEGLRDALQEAYFQSENDAGAYGPSWRREIAINGKRGLADESDAALLA